MPKTTPKVERKKILIISNWTPPETGAGAVRVSSFIQGLSKRYNIITLAPKKQGLKKVRFVERIDLFDGGVNPVKFIKSFFELYKYVRKFKPDLAIGSSPTIFLPFQLAVISNFLKIPFILDSRDISSPLMQRLNPGIKSNLFRMFERFTLKFSTHILVTNNMQQKMTIEQFRISNDKFSILPNGIGIDPQSKVRVKKSYDLAFYGSLNPERDPLRLLKVIMTLPKELKIVFIGTPLSQLEKLYSTSEYRFLLKRVRIVPPLSQARAFTELRKAKIGIITMADMDEIAYQMPVKIYNYLDAGLPVICLGHKSRSFLKNFMKKYDIGTYTYDLKGFAAAVDKIVTSKRLLQKYSKYNTKLSVEFDREKTFPYLNNIIGKFIK